VFSPTIVPKLVTPDIKKLCKDLTGCSEAYYVDVINKPGALRNKCALNAKDEADEKNGNVIFGWSIFVWEKVFVQFIGHAIVEAGGKKYCVTPAKHGESKILFIPDPAITFNYDSESSRMPSKTLPISKQKVVHQLIAVQSKLLEIKSKYSVTSGQLLLAGDDAVNVRELEGEQQELMNRIIYLHHPIKSNCSCGSGKQFRKCCRPHMKRVYG